MILVIVIGAVNMEYFFFFFLVPRHAQTIAYYEDAHTLVHSRESDDRQRVTDTPLFRVLDVHGFIERYYRLGGNITAPKTAILSI